jgi:hypothetical protein
MHVPRALQASVRFAWRRSRSSFMCWLFLFRSRAQIVHAIPRPGTSSVFCVVVSHSKC